MIGRERGDGGDRTEGPARLEVDVCEARGAGAGAFLGSVRGGFQRCLILRKRVPGERDHRRRLRKRREGPEPLAEIEVLLPRGERLVPEPPPTASLRPRGRDRLRVRHAAGRCLVDDGVRERSKRVFLVAHALLLIPTERVKIYATDLDDHALGQARHARYEMKALESVPADLRERYFADANGGTTLRGDIRRSVIFGRNDLLSDPPISKVDLLISRNTLMYFGAEAQHKVLSNFFFALGRPLQDLEVSYRRLELRSRIDRTVAERRPMLEREVQIVVDGGERRFEVQFTPLQSPGGDLLGVSIGFDDVTRAQGLRAELETAKRDLETAYEELQSTVEELETTNEELQSTNEELETMNEELQSTNEELVTMNDELRERTDEAVGASAFLSSVLGSIPAAVVVLDHDLVVSAWSQAATELWGLRPDEAEGQYFLNLDMGLPVDELDAVARGAVNGAAQEPVVVSAHDRRGRPVEVTAALSPLRGLGGEVRGTILAMTAEHAGEA